MKSIGPLSWAVLAVSILISGILAWGPTTASERREKGSSKPSDVTLPWIRHQSQNHGVIVFVHGVIGDARSTWSDGVHYWPSMLTSDPAFDGNDIYVYSYPSPPLGHTMTVDELADNLHLVLVDDKVLEHDRVTFLSHSMGGLITRDYILKYRDEIVPKLRLLAFFATPTAGSPYATLAHAISKNPQFHQMYPMVADSFLAPLQSAWLAAPFTKTIPSSCAYEVNSLYGQKIVDIVSATHLCNTSLNPINANHMTIVKPSSTTDESYRAFRVAFTESEPLQKGAVEELLKDSWTQLCFLKIPGSWDHVPDINQGPTVFEPNAATVLRNANFKFSVQMMTRIVPAVDGVEPNKENAYPYLASGSFIDTCHESDDPENNSEEFKSRAVRAVTIYEDGAKQHLCGLRVSKGAQWLAILDWDPIVNAYPDGSPVPFASFKCSSDRNLSWLDFVSSCKVLVERTTNSAEAISFEDCTPDPVKGFVSSAKDH